MVECQICKKELKSFKSLAFHILTHNITSKEYYDKFILDSNNKCKMCDSECKFINIVKGYRKYCSIKCRNTDQEAIQKIRETNKRTYENNKDEIKKKIEETCLKKYGVKDPNQLQETKNKIKQTKLERGIDEKECLRKRKETNLEKYGVEHYFQSNDFSQKFEIIKEENGGIHPGQTIESKEKRKNTNIKKYGVDNPSKSIQIINKIKEVKRENGVDEKACEEKRRKTIFERYGNRNYNNRQKTKQTCIEKYGVDNVSKEKNIKETKQQNSIRKFSSMLYIYLKELNMSLVDNEYRGSHIKHNWKCLKCGTVFSTLWNFIQQGYLCPTCFPRCYGKSNSEKEISQYIHSLCPNIEVQENNRKIIYPKELDIYIPLLNIAIEYNGLWYHSEDCELGGKNKDYHLNKTIECEKNGIKLVHVFEDEWIFKKNIVKSKLKNILSVNNEVKIGARECLIKGITLQEKDLFLEENHLQGKDISLIKLGAFHNNELVSVMTFSKGNIAKGSKAEDGVWELNRFCSKLDYSIQGIASKFLSYFKNNYDWNTIFSYADRRWSIGNLYYKLGFELEKTTSPNYWYIKGLKRIHRFNLRKRLDEPKDIPEWLLRQKEGYTKIWDCGHYKFIMENK